MHLGLLKILHTRTSMVVGRSKNPGVPVLFGGHNLHPFVDIGLTDLPKYGGAMVPSAPPGTTGLFLFPPLDFRPSVGLDALAK